MTETSHPGVEGADLPFRYAQTLSRLAAVRIDRPSVEEFLEELLAATQQAMERTISISVTAIEEQTGRYVTAASTNVTAREVDAFEYDLDEGPCIDTLKTGAEQFLGDASTDRTWPRFSAHAAEVGYRAVAGLPLRLDGRTVGALNLYAAEVDGLDKDLMVARRLTEPAAIVLANHRAYRRSHLASEEVQAQLEALAVIHQAIGILVVRKRCPVEAADQLLRAAAEATGRDVQEVAASIVASAGSDPDTPDVPMP